MEGAEQKIIHGFLKGRHKGRISRKRKRKCKYNIKMDVEDIICNFATGAIGSGVGPMATHIDSSSLHLLPNIGTQTVEQVILKFDIGKSINVSAYRVTQYTDST
jgi:hypothetical protein